MKYYLEIDSNFAETSRNDFFYAMMWIFDPAKGAADPNLHHLLSETGFFVAELLRAINANSKQYAANILNGIANLVAYVGRRVVEPYFGPHAVLNVIATLLDSHTDTVNTVSASLLFGNYYTSADAADTNMVARLQTMVPIMANVIRAAITDSNYGGRTWSPKGACEALSNLSMHIEFHDAIVRSGVTALLEDVLFRPWELRGNYTTLGGKYYADAVAYAARTLWNLRFVCPMSSDPDQLAARLDSLIKNEHASVPVKECLAALRDHVHARRPVVALVESDPDSGVVGEESPFAVPSGNWTHQCIVVCEPAAVAAAFVAAQRQRLGKGLMLCHNLPLTHLVSAVREASCVFVLPSPGLVASDRARITMQLAVCLGRPVYSAASSDAELMDGWMGEVLGDASVLAC